MNKHDVAHDIGGNTMEYDPLELTKKFYLGHKYYSRVSEIDNKKVPIASLNFRPSVGMCVINKKKMHTIFTKEGIEFMHPEHIDNVDFWHFLAKEFPLSSVTYAPHVETKEEANIVTFRHLHLGFGTYNLLETILINERGSEYPNMLEIGPGFGNVWNWLKGTILEDYYHAIDISPRFKHPRLYQCNGKSIPNDIPAQLSVVYSINVFQHIAKAHRISYYKDIYSHLKPDGKFIFSVFIITNKNKNIKGLWSLKDVDNKKYCGFFAQFVQVDTLSSLRKQITSIGYEFSVHNINRNFGIFVATKPKTPAIER